MKKGMYTLLIVMALLFITACSREKLDDNSGDTTEYQIYYFDNKTSEFVSEPHDTMTTDKTELVKELIDALRQDPSKLGYKKTLPDNVAVRNLIFGEDGQLTMDFDSAYNDLTGIPEVLCRATIVKTLSQVTGVESIEFQVNGQRLKESDGDIVRLLTKDDFIESTGDETKYKVSLYFANKEGDGLIEYMTNLYDSGAGSLAETAIEQLINGPTQIGLYNTVPEGTTLLNITTKSGICYVDFNEKFLNKLESITDEVAIYSIVNTLVNLPDINKVQFEINGELQKTYGESTPFDNIFEQNLSLIKDSK